MSVWKKASKANQKTHRERHQPESRKHLGLLEKKNEFIKRARDYQEKQQTLKVLRKRALNKNPEEFYHHMINSKLSSDGIHHEKDNSVEHTREQRQLMETQDIRYVNMKRVQEMKRIERLQAQLHLIDIKSKPKSSHKYFFDSKIDVETFTKHKSDKQIELISNYKLDTLSEKALGNLNVDDLLDVKKKRENAYKELAARIKREKELSIVQQKLEIKHCLINKKKCLPPKKICAATIDTPPVYKWKSQRKR